MTLRSHASRLASTSLLLVALTCTLVQEATAQCTNCQNGICYDDPPGAQPAGGGTVTTNPVYYFKNVGGGNYELHQVTTTFRPVKLRTCHGTVITVLQATGRDDQPVPPGTVINRPIINPPGGGGSPPQPWDPHSTGFNCHANTLGLKPGSSPPPPLPQDPGGGGGGSADGGYWVQPDVMAKVTAECFHEDPPPPANPPPAGKKVIWWHAPVGKNGTADWGKAEEAHSATSNGDGTYSSKDGVNQDQDHAQGSDLDSKYGGTGDTKTVSDGHGGTKKVCVVKAIGYFEC